ncbi:MAG: hypothetical protein ACHQCH_08875 [Solirubrobacterales bacterium]|jgi:hypothetical protein
MCTTEALAGREAWLDWATGAEVLSADDVFPEVLPAQPLAARTSAKLAQNCAALNLLVTMREGDYFTVCPEALIAYHVPPNCFSPT